MNAEALQLASLRLDLSNFSWPVLAGVGAALLAVVAAYTRGLRWRGRSGRNRSLLLALRLGAIGCLLAALLHPMWVSGRADSEKPAVAVVLDTSLSMSLPAEGEGGPSRYARAVEVLRGALAPKLAEKSSLRCYDIQGRMLDPARLPERPAAERSPITATLCRVERALRAERLAGIVLLSDGAESAEGAGGPAEATTAMEDLHVPVYPVELARGSGGEGGAIDLSIQAVIANQRAIVGNTVKATVLLAAQGRIDEQNVEVTITDEQSVVARKLLRWHAGETDRAAELDFQAARAGKLTYMVDVRQAGAAATVPAAGGAVERDLSNNRATFPLAVRAQPITVLYVDGVLRWEGKFTREALAGDPDLNVLSSVRTAARSAAGRSPGILTKEQLANVNVVILGDVEPGCFAEAERTALKRWVADGGGGLLLTGGYLSFAPDGFGASVLRDVLPVEFLDAAPTQIDTPFHLRLTDEGAAHPVFHLTGDRVRDRAVWHSLPQLSGCSRVKGIKPGAQVLAVNPAVSAGDEEGGVPVMVVQQVGRGRAMVLAVETTWKWRTIVGGFTGESLFYRKFWGQLVRFLAGAVEAAGSERLFVTTDRYRYREGQPIRLLVELRPGEGPSRRGAASRPSLLPKVDWRVSAVRIDEQGARTRVPLTAAGEGRYEGTIPADRQGRMDFLVAAEPILPAVARRDPDDDAVRCRAARVQVERGDLELMAGRCEPQRLSRLAQVTGGRVLKGEEIGAWRLEAEPKTVQRVEQLGLWHHPVLVAVFFVLLCTEWVMRRMRRLA